MNIKYIWSKSGADPGALFPDTDAWILKMQDACCVHSGQKLMKKRISDVNPAGIPGYPTDRKMDSDLEKFTEHLQAFPKKGIMDEKREE